MARINNTRMSALEFDLTSLFMRRAELKQGSGLAHGVG